MLDVLTDATAAIGICRRRGLGKIRHLAVADLWVQDKVRAKDFGLHKVAGAQNPADILTKHVSKDVLQKHLPSFGLCSSEHIQTMFTVGAIFGRKKTHGIHSIVKRLLITTTFT